MRRNSLMHKWISTKSFRTLFVLIQILWICVLLGNANAPPPSGGQQPSVNNQTNPAEQNRQGGNKQNISVPTSPSPPSILINNVNQSNPKQDDRHSNNVAQWVLIVITFVYAVFAGLQWLAIRGQGETIREQATLTKKIAEANETAANAAKKSADIASRTLILSNRAWIKVEGTIEDDLRGYPNGENAYSISFSYRIRNIGNLVATHITIHAWLEVIVPNEEFPSPEQRTKYETVIPRWRPRLGHWLLFPNEEIPGPRTSVSCAVAVSRAEVARALAVPPVPPGTPPSLTLCIVVCADYTFPSDPDNYHQTWRVYEIRRKGGGLIYPDDGNIRAADLELIDFNFGHNNYAD